MRHMIKLFTVVILCAINHQVFGQKVTKEAFDQMIIGSWEMTEYWVDGYQRAAFTSIEEYGKKQVVERDKTGNKEFLWEFFEDSQVMIRKDPKSGVLSRYKILSITKKFIRYELVTVNGLTECKYMKRKNR